MAEEQGRRGERAAWGGTMRGRLQHGRRTAFTFIRHLLHRFQMSRVGILAAALAYYAAFSLGPLLLLLAGWTGTFLRNRPELAESYRDSLAQLLAPVLPTDLDSTEVVQRSLDAVLTQLGEGAIGRTIFSLIVLLWASSGFFAVLQQALELIFEVPEERSFFRKRAIALLLVAAVALVIAIELIGGALITWVLGMASEVQFRLRGFGLDVPGVPAPPAVAEPLRVLLAVAAFTLCFRYLPRRVSSWWGALVGALVSVIGLQAMRVVLPLVFDAERFNVVYGVVTSLVVLLLWLYLSMLLFLAGALIAAEASAWIRGEVMVRRRGTDTTGPPTLREREGAAERRDDEPDD